jgi:hypothetical protein
MPPFRIVNVIDIVYDQGTGQLGRQIRSIKGQVAFESAEERLRDGIVPTVSPSAHATDDPAGLQRGLVLVAGIGTPSVRVVEEAEGKCATLDGHLQGCQGQLSIVAAVQSVAHITRCENRSEMTAR